MSSLKQYDLYYFTAHIALPKFRYALECHVTNAIALTVPRMESQSCVT